MTCVHGIDMDRLAQVCAEQGLLAVYVFGSVAAGTAAPDSDLDLAVLFFPSDQGWRDVATYITLNELLGECVDGRRLDLILLPKAPLELQYRVLANGKVLWCADNHRRTDYEDRVLRDYLDFAAELRLYEAEVAEVIRREIQHG